MGKSIKLWEISWGLATSWEFTGCQPVNSEMLQCQEGFGQQAVVLLVGWVVTNCILNTFICIFIYIYINAFSYNCTFVCVFLVCLSK